MSILAQTVELVKSANKMCIERIEYELKNMDMIITDQDGKEIASLYPGKGRIHFKDSSRTRPGGNVVFTPKNIKLNATQNIVITARSEV